MASLSEVLVEEVESLRPPPAGFGNAAVVEEEEGEEQQRIMNAEEVVRSVEEALEVAKWKRCFHLKGCSASIFTTPASLLLLSSLLIKKFQLLYLQQECQIHLQQDAFFKDLREKLRKNCLEGPELFILVSI